MDTLTATGFERLLARLGEDPGAAAEGYEQLRRKLIKTFIWRGCLASNADRLADVTLDRVAAKLEQGIEIKSVNAYAGEVSRFVWLEQTRKHKEDAVGDDLLPEQVFEPELPEDPDERLRCLRKCLDEVAADGADRQLIIGYYERDPGVKIKHQRRSLAEKLGVTMVNLKVRACRLRNRLEACINECLEKRSV